ncbi:MAG: amidoligase family protein [Nitrospinota bacterium]
MIPFGPDRTFGVEIEVYDVFFGTLIPPYGKTVPNHLNQLSKPLQAAGIDLGTQPDQWRFVQEDSIKGGGGIEVVSPALMGPDGLDQIATVCAVLKAGGAKVNGSCGLHVHHDASDFTCTELCRLVQLIHRWEDAIYYCLPHHRQENETCRPMEIDIAELVVLCDDPCHTNCRIKDTWYSEKNGYDGKGFKYCKTRYHGLNLHAFWTLGTIEFRYPPSTLVAEKIQGWVGFTQALVERAHYSDNPHPLAELHWEFEHLMGWLPLTDNEDSQNG